MRFKDAQKRSLDMFTSHEFKERIRVEDASMLEQLPILERINSLGFLTTESQAGKRRMGRDFEIHERAYISGFMLEKQAQEFLKKMNIQTDKNAIFIPYCADGIKLPAGLDIPLTISKDGTEVYTHTSTALPESVWNSFRMQLSIDKHEKIVYIFCWDTKWNRNASSKSGLFQDIVRVLSPK